jgi:AraC-like DNA-binding protein
MKLFIKNMVCSRCKMVVTNIFEQAGIKPLQVELGEIEVEKEPDAKQRTQLDLALKHVGFELIDDRKSRIIEKIKNILVGLLQTGHERMKNNLSDYLAGKMQYEYTYLSNLFSEVEGTTIEKYFIALRIEKVKELLVYNELSLAEIADQLGYSSSAYLSAQFKQVTGLTPSFYRNLKEHKRKNIEEL